MNRRDVPVSCAIVLCLACSTVLLGSPVDSRITAVTVYSDRAIVTRTASNELPAGEHTLAFENLPSALLDPSLQASGKGVGGTTILDVRTQTVFAETTANERVRILEDQLQSFQKQRRVMDDRVRILEQQREFVQRMLETSTTPVAGATARPTLDEWKQVLAYSDESLGRIVAELQSIDAQREDLQARELVLNQQLNELRVARGRRSKTVTVRVALTTAGHLEVAIRYAIPNASWSPAYDARLQSVDRTVRLSYFGNVRNGTGEDWNDIALTLSTARPSAGGGPPELRPWIADVFRPRGNDFPFGNSAQSFTTTINPDLVGEIRLLLSPVDAELGRGNGSTPRQMPASPPPPPVRDAAALTAEVESAITSATFKIPVSVTIPGDDTVQKVAIKETALAAALQFLSIPKLVEAAFLNASATNTSDYPLLAGPMNTFFDETFIAASALKTVMPGEKFDLALGVDDGISVKRKVVNRFTENTGFTNKSRRVTYEILISLTNNKPSVERVVFKEPTPVSRDEKIVVKLLTPQEKEIGTAANPREVSREEDGKLSWSVNLKPGEKREFSLKLSVEHPGDIRVTGLE